MPSRLLPSTKIVSLRLVASVIEALRSAADRNDLERLIDTITREMGFRYFAVIEHDALHLPGPDRIDVRDYPTAIVEHLIAERNYRRDPVLRGCVFADSAFLWSELPGIIRLNKRDRSTFELGARLGLNEGITVPFSRLGDRLGSCTFAGTRHPERAHLYLGAAQMIGIFAFQSARRLVRGRPPIVSSSPRLHPRPRDCIVLAGRGYTNKEIARELALTPRTVDGYLTEARRRFDAHDRTELVVSAILAGEIELHELKRGQPE
jgi:LuxR family quorum-sensing system transcriptional regulator CciR